MIVRHKILTHQFWYKSQKALEFFLNLMNRTRLIIYSFPCNFQGWLFFFSLLQTEVADDDDVVKIFTGKSLSVNFCFTKKSSRFQMCCLLFSWNILLIHGIYKRGKEREREKFWRYCLFQLLPKAEHQKKEDKF